MTTDLPGSTIEAVDVALHGVNIPYAGRKTYTHTLSATFLETADYSTREKFRRWHESMRSWSTNTGSLYASYAVSCQIAVYNDLPAVVKTINIYGLWPEVIAEVPLNGGASELITLAITFRYSHWEDQ